MLNILEFCVSNHEWNINRITFKHMQEYPCGIVCTTYIGNYTRYEDS